MFGRFNRLLDYSVPAGRLFGIPIRLHISLLFFLWPVLASRWMGIGISLEIAVGIVFSILLHELGHALMAKRFHLSGLSIMLHGFGGFATSRGIRTPMMSLLISLAGPAVTFALGFLGLGIARLGGNSESIQFLVIWYLGYINILMGILNMIPSFPFDGGNSLQAILWRRMTEHKAMRSVGHLGLIVAPIVLIYGLFIGQTFIALFGFIGAYTSYITLANSGGIRFREVLDDRRDRKEAEAAKKRAAERHRTYLDDVMTRQKEREERERLRTFLESSLKDD